MMKLQIMKVRERLSDSFWFVPTVMAVLAAGTALGAVALDHRLGDGWVPEASWVWAGGADGARAVMATVAGSLITVISIVFSLTITTLAQSASRFGSRVLRNFTSDRGVQITLGTFIATFIYCLLVMRTVRSVEESTFVPYLAVNLGLAFTLGSLAVLIYFIHHISQEIQAENLIAAIGKEFLAALPVLFPRSLGHGDPDAEDAPPSEEEWEKSHGVGIPHTGYLQAIDNSRLMCLATKHSLVLKLDRRPGHFIKHDCLLLQVLPVAHVSDAIACELQQCFITGRNRTPHQDALYSIQQLVEIAAHALSPGINEPFTALTCLDWLGACLLGVARAEPVDPLRRDATGRLRVIAKTVSFSDLATAAFSQIRIFGVTNPEVLRRLLEVIGSLTPALQRRRDCKTLLGLVGNIGGEIARLTNVADRDEVTTEFQQTLEALTIKLPTLAVRPDDPQDLDPR